jgi:predicted nucleic-acid-binding Zn-ribbon protein
MPRAHNSIAAAGTHTGAHLDADAQRYGRALTCAQCGYGLECVEQNRRSGTWVGSFICPKCRSEYFYAYRWGRLLKKDEDGAGSRQQAPGV